METETRVTATELAKNLSDILNPVRYRGEHFVVERNGEPVATIAPVQESARATTVAPFGGLVRLLQTLEPPDDRFADDLEEIRRSQSMIGPSPWPS